MLRPGWSSLSFQVKNPFCWCSAAASGRQPSITRLVEFCPFCCQDFDVVHVVGNGNLETLLLKSPAMLITTCKRNLSVEQFGHVLAAAAVVVSRAGANSIYELLTTRKPHLLIPLGKDHKQRATSWTMPAPLQTLALAGCYTRKP